MDLPSHPDTDGSAGAPDRATRPGRGPRIVVGAIIALVVVMIVLHLTGVVGPG